MKTQSIENLQKRVREFEWKNGQLQFKLLFLIFFDENSKSIENLQKRVRELEWKNGQLQFNKFEGYFRKDNLIINGTAETGPNYNVSEVAADFFKDNLKVPEAHKIGINYAHRLGQPPHLITMNVKTPRDIIVRFQSASDRAKVWKHRFNLKGHRKHFQIIHQ